MPGLGLTAMTALSALALVPENGGLMSTLRILPAWMALAALIFSAIAFVRLLRAGVASPFAEVRRVALAQPRRNLLLAAGVALAGMNLIAFMWLKPLLNALVPFTADRILADIGEALFLGTPPWRALAWANLPYAGMVYHPLWFVTITWAFLLVLLAPPSPRRSAALLGYFALWSLAGPLIHLLVPAAGPIFYERLGYGNRFAGLDGGAETRAIGDYLWTIYAGGAFGAGGGISAMPSLHVATSAWTVIAVRVAAPMFAPLAVAAWLAIAVLSVALGWHYVMDGVVGTLAAVAIYAGLESWFRRRAAAQAHRDPVPAPEGLA